MYTEDYTINMCMEPVTDMNHGQMDALPNTLHPRTEG